MEAIVLLIFLAGLVLEGILGAMAGALCESLGTVVALAVALAIELPIIVIWAHPEEAQSIASRIVYLTNVFSQLPIGKLAILTPTVKRLEYIAGFTGLCSYGVASWIHSLLGGAIGWGLGIMIGGFIGGAVAYALPMLNDKWEKRNIKG